VAGFLAGDWAWATPPGESVNGTARVAATTAAVEGVLASSAVVAVEHPPAALAAFSPAAGVWSTVDEWHARRLRSRWGAAGGLVALLKALEEQVTGGNAAAAAAETRASLVTYCDDYRARVAFTSASAGQQTLLMRAAEVGDGADTAAAAAAATTTAGGAVGGGARRPAAAALPASTVRAARGGVRPTPTRVRLAARGTAEEALHQRRRQFLTSPWRATTASLAFPDVLPSSRPTAPSRRRGSTCLGPTKWAPAASPRRRPRRRRRRRWRRPAASAASNATVAGVAAAGDLGGLKRLGGEAAIKDSDAVAAAAHETDAAARAAAAARMATDEVAVTTGMDMAA